MIVFRPFYYNSQFAFFPHDPTPICGKGATLNNKTKSSGKLSLLPDDETRDYKDWLSILKCVIFHVSQTNTQTLAYRQDDH